MLILVLTFIEVIILGKIYYRLVNKSVQDSHSKDVLFYYIILTIAIIALGYMMNYSAEKSLWYDDLYQIKFSGGNQSITQVFKNILSIDMQPPLFGIIAMFWLRVVPYGTFWVKLLSELFVTGGIILLGLIGKTAYNRRVGVICSITAAFSSTICLNMAYSFRPYGLLFFAMTLLIFSYLKRNQISNKRTLLLYGFSVLILVGTYYIGAIVCSILFIFDLIQIVKEKRKINNLLPYFIPAGILLPWVLLSFGRVSDMVSNFWPKEPTLKSIYDGILFLCSYQECIFALFIISTIYILLSFNNEKYNDLLVISFFVVYGIIAILFLYSKTGTSIWQNRYLLTVIPFVVIMISFVIDKCITYLIIKNNIKLYAILIGTYGLYIFASWFNQVYLSVTSIYEPFEEAADILREQEDIYDPTTIIYSSTVVGEGWNYYLTKNGKLPSINWCDNSDFLSKELENYDVIYFFDVHNELPAEEAVIYILENNYIKETIDEQYHLYRYSRAQKETSYAHFSLDDTINIFEDLYVNKYNSIFENETLQFLRELHDNSGAVFSLYCFYEKQGFNLSMLDSRYADEFQKNADWLKLGFHGKNEETSYERMDYESAYADYKILIENLLRITGDSICIDHVPRISFYQGSEECMRAFGDSKEGIKGALSADDDRLSYYFQEDINYLIKNSEQYRDEKESLTFFHTDLRIENEEHMNNIESILKHNEELLIFTHEWQLNNPDIIRKISELCDFLYENNIYFDYPENHLIL